MKIDWKVEVEKIKTQVTSGKTIQEVGDSYGVSKQRIYQVMTKFGITTNVHTRKNFLRDKAPKYYWFNTMLTLKKIDKSTRTRLLATFDLPDLCPILGIPLNYTGTGTSGWSRGEDSPSIDQILPGEGYKEDNMLIVSWRANRIKNNGSPEEHYKIYDYYSKLTKKDLHL